jgi:hypothetical protein
MLQFFIIYHTLYVVTLDGILDNARSIYKQVNLIERPDDDRIVRNM